MGFPASTRHIPEYYNDITDSTDYLKMLDFDNRENLKTFERRARLAGTRNFLLDFGYYSAWCGFDLNLNSWIKFLNKQRPTELETRWINIWAPNEQVNLIKALASKYGFSPRLTEIMCSSRKIQTLPRHNDQASGGRRPFTSERTQIVSPADLEHSAELPSLIETSIDLNHYDLVGSMWNWSSVDVGGKYLCLGYNSIYNASLNSTWSSKMKKDKDLPKGERLWTWLILCNDRSVISITEDPFLPSTVDVDATPIRRNLLNVFCQLSKADDPSKRSAISLAPLRFADNIDSVGLLFYYLFDDWQTTYSLLAKGQGTYGARLNSLRNDMMKDADLEHINELHRIGRQLSVLRRLYQGYDLILRRVLENQEPAPPSQSTPFSTPTCRAASGSQAHCEVGVYLTSAARSRFERLRDRIRLYAMSYIEEHTELKESLVMMNFNLITIKESNAVERLTRVTILLAKLTILFLPVSLMTTYFATPLVNESYTVKAYWTAFAVVFFVSFLMILGYGKLSGTVEGNMVYRPIERVLLDLVRGKKRASK